MLVEAVFIVQLLTLSGVRGQLDWDWEVPFEGEVITQSPPNNGTSSLTQDENEDSMESEVEGSAETSSNQNEQWALPRLTGLAQSIADPVPSALEVIEKLYGQGSPMVKSLTTLFIDESVKNILLSRTISENPGEVICLVHKMRMTAKFPLLTHPERQVDSKHT